MDDFGLEETVDGLGQRVVVGIADAADRAFDPGFGEPLGVANRKVLHAAIAVVYELAVGFLSMESLFEGVERQVAAK